MRITDLEFYVVSIARLGMLPPVRSLLVRLTTDSGREGWGESGLAWRVGELAARRDAILPVLAGRSIFDTEELHTLEAIADPALRLALEMASWDLIGRATGQPLCRLFGGEYRRRIPVAVRLGGRSPQRMAQTVRENAMRGFSCMVIPSTGHEDLDCQMLDSVRDGVGDRLELRLDGASRYEFVAARDLCSQMERHHIQFLLDPLRDGEFYPVASLSRQTVVPLALGRTIAKPADVLMVVRCGAAAYVAIDLERVSGLLPARACGAIAAAAQMTPLLSSRPTLGIATAAMLQLAASSPVWAAANETSYHLLRDDVLTEPLGIEGGMMAVPQGPGLGIEVDRVKIERYAVS